MKKIVAVLLSVALALTSLAALAEGAVLMPVELNVDSLEYVDETHYLIARDADSRLYGLYNTDGEMLIPCEYGLLAYAEYGFFEAINEDGLNTHALLRADGQAVTGWEYAAFEILNEKWGLAVTLEPTESEDYDYSGGFFGGGEHYVVTAYDVYDLEAGQKVGTLSREDCDTAVPHGDYLYVEDRQEVIHVYDKTLAPVETEVTSLYNAYGEADGNAVCLSDGRVIAEDAYSAYEDTDTGYIKVNGSNGVRLVDAEGNVLVPEGFDSIGVVYDGYVTVEQDDLYGLYDLAGGRLAVPCEYDEVYYFGLATIYRYVNNGYVCVEKDGKVGFVDTNGQVTCELKYGAAGVTQHGCSLTVTDLDGSIYIVAADGTQTKTDFDEVDEYSGGDGSLLIVCKDDAYGLVDWHGNEVPPLEYASYDISITDYADAVIVDDTLMVR